MLKKHHQSIINHLIAPAGPSPIVLPVAWPASSPQKPGGFWMEGTNPCRKGLDILPSPKKMVVKVDGYGLLVIPIL